MEKPGKVLVAGASGFVGRRLVPALLAAGWAVRCLARHPEAACAEGAEPVQADLLEPESLAGALQGIDTAYYLVHSLNSSVQDFAARDRQAATNFVAAAQAAGVRRVIYLSGLGDRRAELSEHLKSRHEVGDILRAAPFATTVLRAAVILGAGGASFELLRYLVKTQPLLLAPPWLETRCQPIAITDVIGYLVGCLTSEATAGETLDIGGPEVLTYRQLLERFAKVSGDVVLFVPTPVFPPKLIAGQIALFSRLKAQVVEALLAGLGNEVVCRDDRIGGLIPFAPTPVDKAIRSALQEG